MCFKKKKPKPPEPPVVDPPVDPPEPPITSYPRMKKAFCLFIPELMVAVGDIEILFKNARKAGVWYIRFFLLQSWSTNRLVPWMQAMFNGEPVRIVISEEHLDTPVTDLDQSNPAYWERLSYILGLFKKYDLVPIMSLGDNCSQNTHTQTLSYPFFASTQIMPGEIIPYVVPVAAQSVCRAAGDGLYGHDRYDAHKMWIRQVVLNSLASIGWFEIEIQNEFSRRGWADAAPQPEDWYRMLVDELPVGIPIWHSGEWRVPLLDHEGNVQYSNRLQEYGGTYSCHGIVRPAMPNLPGADLTKVLMSGDGGYNGQSETDVDVMGRKGLSVDDAKALAQLIVDYDMVGIEWMPKYPWRFDDNLANVDGLPMDIPAAMAYIWK